MSTEDVCGLASSLRAGMSVLVPTNFVLAQASAKFPFQQCCPIRMGLLELGWFGDVNRSVQQRLDVAFNSFKQFCKSRMIQCSQPPFTEKMETLTRLALAEDFLCMPSINQQTCAKVGV